MLDTRRSRANGCEWVFAAQTRSGHIEPASIKRQHLKACKGQAKDDKQTGEKRFEVRPFPLCTLRHTCLTRWAPHMDPWTLAYLAGHRDMAITKRYVHPQTETIRDAMEKARVARSGHTSGHTSKVATATPMGDTAAAA
jgi:integrase